MTAARDLSHRDTILLEEAEVLEVKHHAGEQVVMRLSSPEIAAACQPGVFVHLRCEPSLLMRRPMSVMRADAARGTLDILFKVHGLGTEALAKRQVGERLSMMGPIGKPFRLEGYRARPLLIGGGVGIPPMIYLAEHLRRSQIMVPGVPSEVIAAMPLLEDWGIASRLASLQGYAGCFEGYVTDLAAHWIGDSGVARDEVEIFACGPTPMLRAVQQLAVKAGVPAQISLEEYMACAVGGCAVRIETPQGPAMKRVCVDGPVFEAASVVFG